jgi:predicted MPP superfamily phosphohydrolase
MQPRVTAAPAEAAGVAETAKRAFFRSFFRLLLVFVALAEWACIAWLLRLPGVRPPVAVHLALPAVIYQLNRRVISRPALGRTAAAAVRLYVACAFTSIFCGLFLALAGVGALAGALVAPLLPSAVTVPASHVYLDAVNFGFATVGGLLAYGYVFGPRALTTTRLRVPVRDLPTALAGLTVVHLSDLHVGQHMDLDELAAHVQRVNALEPDLICITGDLVDRAETCARAFPVLAGLRARHGVLVTLGNHDFYAGAEGVTAALRALTPFTVLRNQGVRLAIEGATLTVVGLDDLGRDWARGIPEHPALPGLAAAMGSAAPVVVLSHRPDCFPQAARLGAALVLSGHTHGGQLALPPWNLARFITRFDRGLYRDGAATLYVNRGLGFTGQKVRLFTPREIACLELTPA